MLYFFNLASLLTFTNDHTHLYKTLFIAFNFNSSSLDAYFDNHSINRKTESKNNHNHCQTDAKQKKFSYILTYEPFSRFPTRYVDQHTACCRRSANNQLTIISTLALGMTESCL